MNNPWDPLPNAAKGSTADEIHLAVGRALTQWERLEFRLAQLYAELVSTGGYSDTAFRAFGVVAASAGRLEMLAEATRISPRPTNPLRAAISDFTRRAGKYSARRNEIAHGVAVNYGGNQSDIRLLPAFYNSRKHKRDPLEAAYCYAFTEISYYQTEFHRLTVEADDLLSQIRATPSPFLLTDQQQTVPLKLECNLACQQRCGPQPQASRG